MLTDRHEKFESFFPSSICSGDTARAMATMVAKYQLAERDDQQNPEFRRYCGKKSFL